MLKLVIGERMRRSYKVTLPSNLRYKNDRSPHVETDQEDIPCGTEYVIGARRAIKLRGNYVVMYDVEGLMNGPHPAHITVYFGPSLEEANTY